MFPRKRILIKLSLINFFLIISPSACTLPTFPPPCSVDFLVTAINNANATPATTDTIELAQGCLYELDQIAYPISGDNGLPPIKSPIIINGNEAKIHRSLGNQQPHFRLFYISPSGDLTLNDLTLSGGIAINSSNPSDFYSNSGGAILNMGRLIISKCLITENMARRQGGGILNAGTMEITYSTISENQANIAVPSASAGGAGIYNQGNAVISHSTISGNGFTANWDGWDGIFNAQGAELDITNTTISGNAGLGIDNEGDVELMFVTFANNQAAFLCYGGDVIYTNTIFGPSSSPYGTCQGHAFAMHPQGANVDLDGSCSVTTISKNQLKLAPLGDYGGPTYTHALLEGSWAIDRANCRWPPYDQRGEPRPSGAGCDLGAYEFDADNPPGPLPLVGETPTVTVTPTVTTEPDLFGTILQLTMCWHGPGRAGPYEVISSIQPDTPVEVLGTGEGGGYVVVTNPKYKVPCWVEEGHIDIGQIDLSRLPVFEIPILILETPTGTVQTGCLVPMGGSAALECVVPCPDPALYTSTCTP
jgi:hypothetical protein